MADNEPVITNTSEFVNTSLCGNQWESTDPGLITAIAMTHGSLLVALLGIPANIFALLVLRRDPSKTTTRFLLMALAVEDLVLIFAYLAYYVAPNYKNLYEMQFLSFLLYVEFISYSIMNWVKMAEIYTVLLVTLDRYIAIHYPLRAVSLCRVSNARRALIGIVIVSFLIKLPNDIISAYKVVWHEKCKTQIKIYYFGGEPWYQTFELFYKNIFDQVLGFLIPSVTLIVLNTCLIVRIRSADNERSALEETKSCISSESCKRVSNNLQVPRPMEKQSSRSNQRKNITITLICVITIFLLCETPTTIMFIIDMIRIVKKDDSIGAQVVSSIYPTALILMFVNCASNFFVYVLIGRKFRNLFLRLFCRHCRYCFPPEQRQTFATNEMSTYQRSMLKTTVVGTPSTPILARREMLDKEQKQNNGGTAALISVDVPQNHQRGQTSGITTECYMTSV